MEGNTGGSSKDPPDPARRTKLKFKPKLPPKKATPQPENSPDNSDSDEEVECSTVPTILPLKRPGAEDPGIPDDSEDSRMHARELGLLEDKDETSIIFFQLPATLPFCELRKTSSEKEESEGEKDAKKKGCSLKELPEGHLGKLLIYKSGKVKMKLGEKFIFDVSAGQDCNFQQDVAVIDTKERKCCILGTIDTRARAVVTPDFESLLR